MYRQSWKTRFTGLFVAMTAVSTLGALPAFSQVPVDDYGNPLASTADAGETGYSDAEQTVALSASELDELVGPVALYPDDLLAIVLPASTYPLEIVQAARFLEQYEQDSTLKPNEDWDESVTALLNYPEVLRMMNDDIDWTWKLGDAVVNQQADVIAAVESFRDRAYAAGNLKSDQHQTVSEDDGIIEIVPVDEEIIYVPYYEPEQVVIRQVTPVYYYYPRPYPVYYYPYPVGYTFYSGYFWGVTTAFQIGWATDHLRVCHQSYWGHPYFGHSYYGHYYRSPSVYVYNNWYVNNAPYYTSNRYRDGDYWRPRTHSRARPAYYSSRTRSYRDNDVNRGSSARSYGNAYTSQVSTSRVDRPATNGERVRTQQGSTRDVRSETRSDSIRFRERSDSRQTTRQVAAAGVTRSGTTARTDSRATRQTGSASQTVQRAIPRTDLRTDLRTDSRTDQRNSNRDAARTEVRTEARADSRSEPRQEGRQTTRNEPRNESSTESRGESRSESRANPRAESRPEQGSDSRQARASAREGSQARRERN